jgi:hypothetical protein
VPLYAARLPAAVPAVLALPALPLSRFHYPRVAYKGRRSFPDAPTPRCAELPAVAMAFRRSMAAVVELGPC